LPWRGARGVEIEKDPSYSMNTVTFKRIYLTLRAVRE
jgi:hypothetical protein